jgi:hypothetical protein
LKSTNNPLSADEIIKGLEGKVDAKPPTIRQALQELEENGDLISFAKAGKLGRPVKLYRPISRDELASSLTRSMVEEKRTKQLLQELIEDSTGRYSLMPPEKVREIFSEAAKRLLSEDPRELFMRFAEWLKTTHEKEVNLLKESMKAGVKKDIMKHKKIVDKIEMYCNVIFNHMLGAPAMIRQTDGNLKPGPIWLKFNTNTMQNESWLDYELLKKYIRWAIHGKSVLELFPVKGEKPPIHIGGSDASIQSISLSSVFPWQVEPSEMSIITSIGVRYDIYKGVRDIDRQPDPKVLAQYERRRAIEEGLLIPPPGSLGYAPEMENRIKEAAMDLRQYIKDFELLFMGEPTVSIHFRDGRIFPLEHRHQDALRMDYHGEMVRTALRAFKNLVNMVGAEGKKTLYCGFVKRPGIDILSPLVMWYIGFGSRNGNKEAIDPEMTLEDFIRLPYSDNYVANQLFAVLKEVSNDKICVTFRLLRRFQSLEEAYILNYEPSDSLEIWKERLNSFAKQLFGGESDDSGSDVIASLCARAAIVQFYCSLVNMPEYETNAQIPRIEFLLPYPDFSLILENPEKGNNILDTYVSTIISVLFYPGVLDLYPDTLFYSTSQLFVAPKPVCDAHICAKEIAKVYRDDFMSLLVKEAQMYWLTKGQSFA